MMFPWVLSLLGYLHPKMKPITLDSACFQKAIQVVLRHEGGFSYDKSDPGGATNFGLSLRYIDELQSSIHDEYKATEKDIRALTQEEAIAIYKKFWWDKYGYVVINDCEVATKIFDLAVNVGYEESSKFVQRALNHFYNNSIAVDGNLGKMSYWSINKLIQDGRSALFIKEINQEATEFYLSLVIKNPALHKFLKGWLNRLKN